MDGFDVSRTVSAGEPSPHKFILLNSTPDVGAIRAGDWKLIVSTKGEPQLFNLASDPNEANDLAKGQPERVVELQKRLDTIAAADNEVKVKKGT